MNEDTRRDHYLSFKPLFASEALLKAAKEQLIVGAMTKNVTSENQEQKLPLVVKPLEHPYNEGTKRSATHVKFGIQIS